MSKNRKLGVVVRHEFLTIIRQPSFWISLVAFPLIIGLVILIGALTDSSESVDPENNTREIVVVDESGVIDADVVRGYHAEIEPADRMNELVESVKSGSLDGLIVYPSDLLETGKYQMYADDTDDDNSGLARELGRIMLQQSLLAPLGSEDRVALALAGGEGEIESYTDGELSRGISEYIVPGAFLVLFYVVLVFSVGYALTSVSEEKENRSIEMVLSYVRPQTLIFGKLLAIVLVTLTQILFIIAMALVAYLVARSFGNDLSLPFSVSDLAFVPTEIIIGAGFLVFGFIFYVGLMAMIGAIFPSSKEASGFSTVFFILPAVPFWGMNAILNEPGSMFTQILTYFPLTSTTTVLIRNAAGNLDFVHGLLALALLVAATVVVIILAAKAFRLGTLEYSERIKLSLLFQK